MSEYAPYIDLLTGAYDETYFEALLAKAVASAQKSGSNLTVLRIDVDETQEHNDVHGRGSVDQALSWLASKLSLVTDGKGPIGRIGGDEFAIFLPCGMDDGIKLAHEIRKLIPKTLHASAFGDYRLTVSVGVASLKRGEPWGNLYEAAEGAVTRAKQGGRDTVVCR